MRFSITSQSVHGLGNKDAGKQKTSSSIYPFLPSLPVPAGQATPVSAPSVYPQGDGGMGGSALLSTEERTYQSDGSQRRTRTRASYCLKASCDRLPGEQRCRGLRLQNRASQTTLHEQRPGVQFQHRAGAGPKSQHF